MPDLAENPDAALKAALDNLLAKGAAISPRVAELESVDIDLRAAKAELAKAKAEFVAVAAERDKCRSDFAQCKSELISIQGALSAAYRERDEVDRQLKQKGKL